MNNLRVCFFTTYFYPEDFKGNDIAFELSKRGYSITVITGIPNYPSGKFFKGYSLFKKRHELINDVEVIRLPLIPRGNGRSIRLAFNYLSYLFSTFIFTFFFSFRKRFDVVFVQQLSPFFVAIPAALMSRRQNIPLYLWVLDLWPESVQAAVGFSNHFLLSILNKMVIGIYKKCSKILIGSEGYEKSIIHKGNFADKLVYFPNWAEDISKNTVTLDINTIFPFSSFSKDNFILLFAGNIGESQNLDKLIEAANLTKNYPEIKWVFLGDGRYRHILEAIVAEYNLDEIVYFPGRFPIDTMPVFMERADILLVSLKDEFIFNLTVPSKVQFYMAQSKPILGMLNGDGADLIRTSQCGYCVPAGDYRSFSEIVKQIYKKKDELKILGRNGKNFYDRYFQKNLRIDQLEAIINHQN